MAIDDDKTAKRIGERANDRGLPARDHAAKQKKKRCSPQHDLQQIDPDAQRQDVVGAASRVQQRERITRQPGCRAAQADLERPAGKSSACNGAGQMHCVRQKAGVTVAADIGISKVKPAEKKIPEDHQAQECL